MRSAKPDSNRREIVAALRQVGICWIDQEPRAGFDGLAICAGRVVIIEIKRPGKEDNLTPGESKMRLICTMNNVPYNVVTTIEEALKVCGY